MDELDNNALSLVLILDDELFPQLLDWSASQGWSDLVLFLLETDYFRFKTNGTFEEADCVKPSLYEAYHLIKKNQGGHFTAFFTPAKLSALNRLVESGIPLHSVYSQVCNDVWNDMVKRSSQIVGSVFWPSVRRGIVEKHEITIEDMLNDPLKRHHFDKYIQGEPSDLAALQCLLSVRRILKDLSNYKMDSESSSGQSTPQGPASRPAASKAADFFGFFGGGSLDESGSSIMRRWRTSKYAVTNASKALQAPYTVPAQSVHSMATASQHQGAHEYSDPFEAFKIVLEGTRRLQKQFFPSGGNGTVSGTNSAFTAYSGTGAASVGYRSGTDSDTATSSTITSPQLSGNDTPGPRPRSRPTSMSAGPGHGAQQPAHSQRNCAGISEALRIEIQNTLTVNASVRSREIDTVDRAFAFACAHMLEKLLVALEQEMLSYISDIFAEFVETNDYARMVAHARALQCPRIADYTAKLEFLYDRVRQQRTVSWKDTHTKGKVFLAYEQLSAEGDAPLPAFSSEASASAAQAGQEDPHLHGDDNEQRTEFRPNVVAISLEVVVPQTTLLSPATVASCPHRVTLYAGGKRRAARLRSRRPVLLPQSRSGVTVRGSTADLSLSDQGSLSGPSMENTAAVVSPKSAVTGGELASDSPARSPMRKMSSVTFQLDDDVPSLSSKGNRLVSGESREGELGGSNPETERDAGVNEADQASPNRAECTRSGSEGDDDVLSDLPSLGIAGSIKSRTITSVSSIGATGLDCFNDILDATASSAANDAPYSGDAENEEEEEQFGQHVDYSSSSASESSLSGSDSSSDYDDDVRHVYSTTDLDQLMRMGYSPSPDDGLSDSPQQTPRGGSAGVRSRRGSSRMISRTASYASVNTAGTGTTGYSRANSAARGMGGAPYEEGGRRLVAIDLTKLDRCLHKEVLGTALLPPEGHASKPAHQSSSGRKVSTKGLVASLAVALAAAKEDDDQFGRKFATSVEEAFTFTTDTKGLSLLQDLLFNKRPTWQGPDSIPGYVKSFATAMSVYRQNAMLDTSRPMYRVSVQVQATPVTPVEAARLKAQLTAREEEGRPSSASLAPSGLEAPHSHKGPPHLKHHHQQSQHSSFAAKIPYSHIRIGVSFTRIVPEHSMLTALESIALAACTALQAPSESISAAERAEDRNNSDRNNIDGMKLTVQTAEPDIPPMPVKLRYVDSFSRLVHGVTCDASATKTRLENSSAPQQESLYELYLGTEPTLTKRSDAQSGLGRKTAALCDPISRHVGVCDFSLSEMLTTVSTRLMLQILMLVLVDRPLMLISTSSTLLSQVQAAIPRLIWPFRVDSTHVVRQIPSGAELHHFVYRHDVPFVSDTQQPVIREKKMNRKMSSWREMITRFATNVGSTLKSAAGAGGSEPGSPSSGTGAGVAAGIRSPRNSFTRGHRKTGSSSDLLSGMLRRSAGAGAAAAQISSTGSQAGSDDGDRNIDAPSPADPPGGGDSPHPPSEPRSPYTRIVTPPSLQLPIPVPSADGAGLGRETGDEVLVDQYSCILGVDANAFYTAAPELRDELECMRIRGSGFTFIDIDSGIVLNRHPDDFSEDDGEAPPKPLPSRLSDVELFRAADFGVLRSLVKEVARVNEDLLSFACALYAGLGRGRSAPEYAGSESTQIAAALTKKIVSTNCEIEKAFYAFWSEFVLRAIPRCVQHFPGPKVISCDIRAVLTELLHTVVASSASYEMGEDYEDLLHGAGSVDRQADSYGAVAAALRLAQIKQLPPAQPPSLPMLENMNRLPFEEFLALFVEQVATHGETNMCYAFYKEFIADGSVVFKNLLLRHSAVLENWNI